MSGTRSFFAVLRRLRRYPSLWLGVAFFLNVAILSGPRLAHSQDAQSPAPSTSLRGTVINSVTREPIAHALVFSTDNRLAGFTDDQGRFEFQLPRSDFNPLMFPQAAGFLQRFGPIECAQTRLYRLGDCSTMVSDDMTIRMTPESLIVGRVNLPSSNQFDRITVEVYSRQVREGRPFWAPVASTTTRSSGEFRIANLAAGSYKIFTDELLDRDPITFVPGGRLFGYPPIYYPAARDFDSASVITLEAGQDCFRSNSRLFFNRIIRSKSPFRMFEPDRSMSRSRSKATEGRDTLWAKPVARLSRACCRMARTQLMRMTQQGEQTASGSVNITVKDAPLTHASMVFLPNGSIPVNIKDELSDHHSNISIRQGGFSREQRAEVSLQPADEFVDVLCLSSPAAQTQRQRSCAG